MKAKKKENQKLMQDIAAENKQLLEPLHVAVRQVEELRRDLKDYEKDKEVRSFFYFLFFQKRWRDFFFLTFLFSFFLYLFQSLRMSKGRLVMLKRRVTRMTTESKTLEERYEKIEGERSHLLETFQGTVEQVQRKSELKNVQLGERLERVDAEYGTRAQQVRLEGRKEKKRRGEKERR